MRAFLAALLLCLATAALGHSWYDTFCCSGSDCSPIDNSRVERRPHGYLIDGEYFVEQKDARQSQDGDYHACFWPTPDKLRCFYAPPEGS